ncbi:S41 family peptidase [Crocinitomix algicola]|uniref:S41 family peptidase n=1 Tax=Crocinitomix algicola TaxID=1740263 RepID=UPI00082E9781|nr:S41 family peptidase [Crocinitomix algicola]
MKRIKLLLTTVLTFLVFGLNAQPEIEAQENADFELLKNLELFELVYKNVDLNYVDEPNPGALMKAAIDAMLYELDPYTTYIPESKIEDFKLMSTGQYGGIGAIIRQNDNQVMVVDPHEGFPAQKAGLKAGDIFLEINGKSVEGLSTSEVSEKLKGKPGTSLEVKVERDGGELVKTLTREEIKFSPVPYYGMVNEKVGYIKLGSFTQTAGADVLEAFKDLKGNQGMEQLIFDLRGNGGGLLIEAVKIVNMFIDKGTDVVSIKGRDPSVNQTYKAVLKPEDTKMPIVVLVDGGSASASEIVSGALQDLDRAVVLGQTSFGKGLVQRPLDLKYNAKVKVTIAKYYTPSGRCIQKLDYTHRKTGSSAGEISDSLLHKFKTKNGREVIDGRGVEPDVHINEKEFAALTANLVLNNIIFDYATKFEKENEAINDPRNFEITDEIYSDFSNFVLQQDFEYQTVSLELLKKVEEAAQDEASFEKVKEEYQALMDKLKPSKSEDLQKYKTEIIPLLSDEIIGRYYYQKGRIQHSLVKDEFILESIEILNDLSRYNSILKIEN